MVPISDFSNGKSAAAFAKVKDNNPVTVLKNNRPAFFVISPEDYRQSQRTANMWRSWRTWSMS